MLMSVIANRWCPDLWKEAQEAREREANGVCLVRRKASWATDKKTPVASGDKRTKSASKTEKHKGRAEVSEQKKFRIGLKITGSSTGNSKKPTRSSKVEVQSNDGLAQGMGLDGMEVDILGDRVFNNKLALSEAFCMTFREADDESLATILEKEPSSG